MHFQRGLLLNRRHAYQHFNRKLPLSITRRTIKSSSSGRRNKRARLPSLDRFQGLVFPLALSFAIGLTLIHWKDKAKEVYDDWFSSSKDTKKPNADDDSHRPKKSFEQVLDEAARRQAGLPVQEDQQSQNSPHSKDSKDKPSISKNDTQQHHDPTEIPLTSKDEDVALQNALSQHVGKVLLWGRNVASSRKKVKKSEPEVTEFHTKKPSVIIADDVVLRDLAITDSGLIYAVDPKGNVLRLGDQLRGATVPPQPNTPSKTFNILQGQNIVQIGISHDKLYALSKNGSVWVIKDKGDSSIAQQLKANVELSWFEHFSKLSTGKEHVILLTNKGRCFSTPSSLLANAFGQLGVKDVDLKNAQSGQNDKVVLAPDDSLTRSPERPKVSMDVRDLWKELDKKPEDYAREKTQHYANAEYSRGKKYQTDRQYKPYVANQEDVDFCSTLYEIPSLQGIQIVDIACGSHHSLALTVTGKILGWGTNERGQLGLGPSYVMPAVPIPVQAPMRDLLDKVFDIEQAETDAEHQKQIPQAKALQIEPTGAPRIIAIAAGGNSSYFVAQDASKSYTAVLASGNGQYGGIGNGKWWNAITPQLVNFGKTSPQLPIKDIEVGGGHVFLTYDSGKVRHLWTWGRNLYGQLGIGNKSNVSLPTMVNQETNPLYLVSCVKWHGYKVEEAIRSSDDTSALFTKIV